jgi:glycosidase
MARSIFDSDVRGAVTSARSAAAAGGVRNVTVGGAPVTLPSPFPSPTDWRDQWVYFLMLDRFNNPARAPSGTWDRPFNFRQRGTFTGVTAALDYLRDLGVGAVWLTPVLKNSRPNFEYNYHGYGAQDFLNLDERFASDGTRATAESEFRELVDQAHARGIYVIVDIVLNHSARVFDYERGGGTVASFGDESVMNGGFGSEPAIQWLNGIGFPRSDWRNVIPAGTVLSDDDAVFPTELQRADFFRRRGSKLTDEPGDSFVRGDFGDMRQLVVEYDANAPGLGDVRARLGSRPVLEILIDVHQYLIAKYDIDGFRIDTVKYVDRQAVETFGNAIREFAQSIGKRNFFTYGEIYDDEQTIADFVGRNGADEDSYGIDAALDFPLFFQLPGVAKSRTDVDSLRATFDERRRRERELLSTHGDAGKFFVSFLDNHDQRERFNHPQTPSEQVSLGLALLFTLQGVPSLYYGTEQGLNGTKDAGGGPDLSSNESSREALWGKPNAFDRTHPLFRQVRELSNLRKGQPALRFGRLYFRPTSGNARDFGPSRGVGGVVAFSRVLSDTEVTVIANTSTTQRFDGHVLQDRDLNRPARQLRFAFGNRGGSGGTANVVVVSNARFWDGPNQVGAGVAAALPVGLQPMEVQIFVPT